MKRMIALALTMALGFAFTAPMTGCQEKTEKKTTTTTKTPGGEVTEEHKDTVKKSGDAKDDATPPADANAPPK